MRCQPGPSVPLVGQSGATGNAQAVVVERPDPLYHQVGHAFVVLKKNASTTVADLELAARSGLANYKVPKMFTLIAEMPLLANGKIDSPSLKTTPGPVIWRQRL